jgi:hypothetical protein
VLKIIWLMFLADVVVFGPVNSASSQTNQSPLCCRSPVRGIRNASVNLTPLFQWWTNHQSSGATTIISLDSPRPLAAWKRIVGTKSTELELCWVVDADIFANPSTSTNARIILQNPPVQEAQQYDSLKSLIPQYSLQITNAQKAYQEHLKAEQRDQARANHYLQYWNWFPRAAGESYLQQANRERAAASAAQNEEREAQQAVDLAEKELSAIPSSQGDYLIDCFALDTGKTYKGLAVYDVGVGYP